MRNTRKALYLVGVAVVALSLVAVSLVGFRSLVEVQAKELVSLGPQLTSSEPPNAAVELTANRTANSKLFSLGSGRFALDSYTSPIHYSVNGTWQDIDNSLTPGIAPWNWQMTKDSYTTKFLNNFNSGQILEFATGSYFVRFQPMALQYSNQLNQIDQLSMPASVLASVNGTAINWTNAYGANTIFTWQNTPGRLAKILKLGVPPRAPAAFIISGGNPVVELNFIFDASAALTVWIGDTQWNKRDDLDAYNQPIYFKDPVGNTLFAFDTPQIWDASGNTTPATQRLKKSGSSLYVSVRVPYTWLQSAVYPVTIDPTVDAQVGASTDDTLVYYNAAWQIDNTGSLGIGYRVSTDQKRGMGLRFTSITVPQAATIDTANITLQASASDSANTVNAVIIGHDTDNAATFSTLADYQARRGTIVGGASNANVTTANVSWDAVGAWTSGTSYSTPEIKTVVQEIVNRAGWASGNAMVLFVDDHAGTSTTTDYTHRKAASYNTDAANAPRLHIEYTAAGGVVAPTVTTVSSSLVEETTASATGNITATGGENATARGIQYDIDTGSPYASNVTENGNFGTGTFTENMTGLTKGELYYFRAFATNSAGNGYGSEMTFLTKPDPATSFNSTDNGTTWLLLGWINGTGMDYVEVRYDTSSAPSGNTSGTLGYWGAGTSVNVTGLNPGTTYYFRIWTHATEGGLWSTSDNNPTAQGTTDIAIPTVTTQAASSVEATTATGNGNITATGGENADERGFDWDVDSGAPYANSATDAGSFGTGAYTKSLTSLPAGTTIYYRAKAHNSAGWGYGTETTFLTKPAAPTGVSATDGTSTSNVTITWTKSTGATGYTIWRDSTNLTAVGDVATYADTSAAAGTITSGNATASDGTSASFVTLSVGGESTNNGTSYTYKVQAYNATGNSANSTGDTGYRGVGALSYQWMRSAADSDAAYSNIIGGTTDPYSDTGAPSNGDGRYYKATLSADGVASANTTADRGYRIAALTVVTNATSSVEETTATASGNITATGGENADWRGFEWDIDSGAPYSSNWTEAGSFGVGNFTYGLTSLTKGELYYLRAMAHNSAGNSYGSEVTFLTKPDPATSFNSTDNGTTWILLGWVNGTGMDYVEIRYDTGSAPATNVTGTLGYWGSGTSANVSGLSTNTTYYFRIWTHATEGGLWSTSDNNPTCQDITDIPASAPTVTSVNSSSVEETTATATGNITATGGENASSRGVQYDIDSGAPYSSNSTENGNFGTGTFDRGLSMLTKGELYYWRAFAANSGGTGYGSELTFLTKPDPATSFNVTDNGTTWLLLGWVNGTGMDYVEVRYATVSAPADNTSGTLGYWGSGTSVNVTGLNPNVTYYFRIFTHATEGGLWSTSDNNPTAQGTTDVAVPTVTTQAATSVEETTATGNGNITATGGENATLRGVEYDIDSGAPYSSNVTEAGSFGTGAFTASLTSLTKGELYYARALAQNSAGTGYGAEITFLTKPDPATSFNVTDNGTTWLLLGWINGTGMDYVEVRYDTGSAPADNTSGTLGFWGSGTSVNVTGLSSNTTYYFRIWTHATEGGLWSTADGTTTAQGTTDATVVPPTVTTQATSAVEETTATGNGNITATGGESATLRGVEYDIDSGAPYASNVTEAGSFGTGAFTASLVGLTKGELYYARALAQNSAGTGYGAEVTFLTKPDPATAFTSTDNGTTWIALSWANGTGADYVEVRYAEGAPPTDNTSGTLGFWGSGTAANVTGLNPSTTYYFRIFTHATEGGLWSTSDNNSTCQDTTDTVIVAPTVTTGAATSVEESTATLNGNVTNTGGENVTRGFQWDTDLILPFSDNWSEGTFGIGAYSHGLIGLNKGDKYAFRATANNTAGFGYGSILYFMTKPDPATGFSATDNGTTWIALGWVNGEGMDYVEVRYATGSAPADNISGTLGYWGSGTSVNVTGLNMNTTYYFRIFTHASENGTWASADGTITTSDTTDVGMPSVTNTGATGVTNNDATLNGTIGDDGGASVNVTWYWDITDYGQTDNWTSSANYTGESAGAISHTITDGLNPNTLYYFIIKVVNTAGTAWSATANFTTLAAAPITPGFTATYINSGQIDLDWTAPSGSVNVTIRAKVGSYPSSVTDGYLVYTGNATSVSDTSRDFDTVSDQIYYTAYSDNGTIWTSFGQDRAGGLMLILGIFLLACTVLTLAMFISRNPMLGFPCVILWAVTGGQAYLLSSATWDIYFIAAFAFLLGMTSFCAFGAYGLRTKKEEVKEGDEFIDEGKDDTKFIDEGGDGSRTGKKRDGNGNGVEPDGEIPSRRARIIRERAAQRRSRWE